MVRDAAQTRRRILAAALDAFADGGFAGARIAGIADAAGANQRMIYAYVGNKEGLFEAVANDVIERVHVEVPFTPDDLASYAVALHDYALAQPEVMRFQARRTLEGHPPTDRELELYGEKVEGIRQAQADGRLPSDRSPVELLVQVYGAVTAWLQVPTGLQPRLDGVDLRANVRRDVTDIIRAAERQDAGS